MTYAQMLESLNHDATLQDMLNQAMKWREMAASPFFPDNERQDARERMLQLLHDAEEYYLANRPNQAHTSVTLR